MLSYIGMIVNMLSGLVLSSFLLRTLGDTEYGLYQTVSSFSSYLVLLEFGTGTVMTRNISVCLNRTAPEEREDALNRNYSTVWMISFVLSAVMLLGGLIFYLNLGSIYAKTMNPAQVIYAKKILVLLFGNIIMGYLNQNTNGFLIAHEEYTFANFLNLIKTVLRLVLLIAIISNFRYAILIAVIDTSLSVLVFLVTFLFSKFKYHTKISPKYFDKTIFKTSVPLCLALLLQTLVNQANNNVDKFVIGVMMDLESVALYSVAMYVFTMFASVGTIPVSMYMPEISRNMSKKLTPGELTETLIAPCRLTVLICGSLLCGFFAVGRQFVTLLYGAEKIDAWLYALIIIVPMFFNMTNAVVINILDITNKRLVRSLALLGTMIANVLLTIWFITLWGTIGAVIATAITLLIGNVLVMNIYYQKKFGLRIVYLFKEAFKGLLPYQIVAGATAFFVARLIPSTFVSFVVGAVIYVALSFTPIFFFGLRPEEKERFKAFAGKVRRKK